MVRYEDMRLAFFVLLDVFVLVPPGNGGRPYEDQGINKLLSGLFSLQLVIDLAAD